MKKRKAIGKAKFIKQNKDGSVVLEIKPKRKNKKLIKGIVDGDIDMMSAGFKVVKHRNPFKKYIELNAIEKK